MVEMTLEMVFQTMVFQMIQGLGVFITSDRPMFCSLFLYPVKTLELKEQEFFNVIRNVVNVNTISQMVYINSTSSYDGTRFYMAVVH